MERTAQKKHAEDPPCLEPLLPMHIPVPAAAAAAAPNATRTTSSMWKYPETKPNRFPTEGEMF